MTRSLTGTELKRLHRDWRRRTAGRLALVLDGVQGPFNVGSIVRTAAAERVDCIWYAGASASPINPKVGKTALGTERYVRGIVVDTAAEAIEAARGDGYRLVGLELAERAVPLHEVELGPDTCLVVGHEDRGINPAVLQNLDAVAYIPQLGRVGSLNVATAAAIGVYEVRRRQWSQAPP